MNEQPNDAAAEAVSQLVLEAVQTYGSPSARVGALGFLLIDNATGQLRAQYETLQQVLDAGFLPPQTATDIAQAVGAMSNPNERFIVTIADYGDRTFSVSRLVMQNR